MFQKNYSFFKLIKKKKPKNKYNMSLLLFYNNQLDRGHG